MGNPKQSGRMKPPGERLGMTHKVTLGEHPEAPTDFYITLNRFPDGRLCEVFTKATNGYQGWCDAVSRLVSLLLQHGVPLEAICEQLRHAHFAPCGRVPHFGFARSFVDYLVRWMESQCGEELNH
jgi:hypothetical protein